MKCKLFKLHFLLPLLYKSFTKLTKHWSHLLWPWQHFDVYYFSNLRILAVINFWTYKWKMLSPLPSNFPEAKTVHKWNSPIIPSEFYSISKTQIYEILYLSTCFDWLYAQIILTVDFELLHVFIPKIDLKILWKAAMLKIIFLTFYRRYAYPSSTNTKSWPMDIAPVF